MIETAYVQKGILYARIGGNEVYIRRMRDDDRMEGFTGSGVTYISKGIRYIWHEDGNSEYIGRVRV